MAPSVILHLTQEVEERLAHAEPAHDYGHVLRVVENARIIGAAEGGNGTVTYLSALLHELVNLPKNHSNSAKSGELCALEAAKLLEREGVEPALSSEVCECIRVHGFSAGLEAKSLEAQILQDADRLDALGAIGIARCFATCASMCRPFYEPHDPFCDHREPDDKKFGLDHFFRKLLRLRDLLNTRTARLIAEQRTEFLHRYLKQLRSELTPLSTFDALTLPTSVQDR